MNPTESGPATHGGPDARGVPLHDFSTNANACEPCPTALAAVASADASRYPDPEYTALRAALAAFHEVEPERIVIAASASEFVRRITAWAAQRPAPRGAVRVPELAYGDYAAAAEACGLSVERIVPGASAGSGDSGDSGGPALAWACDPSAPLGQAHAGLAALVDALPSTTPCVLDRAYEPLRLQGALALDPERLDRVWQLWSPNKALGLTGVRGAYAIAPRSEQAADVARWLRRASASWPIGAHGVAMLDAWTAPASQAWIRGSLDTLREWKAQQIESCTDLEWVCSPSNANYFCARPASPDLAADLLRLREAGIKLRDGASFGLPGRVRLGVLPPHSQQALAAAWRRR